MPMPQNEETKQFDVTHHEGMVYGMSEEEEVDFLENPDAFALDVEIGITRLLTPPRTPDGADGEGSDASLGSGLGEGVDADGTMTLKMVGRNEILKTMMRDKNHFSSLLSDRMRKSLGDALVGNIDFLVNSLTRSRLDQRVPGSSEVSFRVPMEGAGISHLDMMKAIGAAYRAEIENGEFERRRKELGLEKFEDLQLDGVED